MENHLETINRPMHLIIRFSDSFIKSSTTIVEHQKIIDEYGFVWFGKMGHPILESRSELLNLQVKKHVPTFVFLAKGNRNKYNVYQAKLELSSRIMPENEQYLIPDYYSSFELFKHIRFWVKLNEIKEVEFSILAQYKVIRSAYSIKESLVKSSSGHFFIN